MKTMILAVSFLSMLFIAMPLLAVEEHHSESGKPQVSAPADAGKTTASVQQMEEMRGKIVEEKDPKARKELLHKHMQMMRDGMNMMSMMGGRGMMMAEKDASAMPMPDRMAMMEKKMMMMEKMMNQGGGMMGGPGMMGGGGMMGGMMGGGSAAPMDDRMNMMESKMMMMMEMMNGMLMQQEMMMK